MSLPDSVEVQIGKRKLTAQVEERVFADRSAGQYESGLRCYIDVFISDTGIVWAQPENIEVGIAPEIAEEANKLEAQMAAMYEADPDAN